MKLSHNVTFDEDTVLGKAKDFPLLRKYNDDATKKQDEPSKNEPMHDVEGLMDPIDPAPGDPSTSRKRYLCLKGTLDLAERHISPRGTFRESKKPNRYQGYFAAMSTILQTEPCTFEESVKHQVWKDVINEEYESIMKNDVWEVVPKPNDKFRVTSKWIYKLKHGADGSVEKYKAMFVARGFSRKEGVDYDEIFALVSQYTII